MSRGIVLLYHRVNRLVPDPWNLAVTPRHFAEQVEVLKTLTTVVPLASIFESRDEVISAITFDDGYQDNLRNALPVLQETNCPATVFITSGKVGETALYREMWWDTLDRLLLQPPSHPKWDWNDPDPTPRHTAYRKMFEAIRHMPPSRIESVLSEVEERSGFHAARPERRMMTAAEVRQMAASGLIEIGAHTVNHPVLSQLPLDEQIFEIEQSKRSLQDLIGAKISSFAYPNGMLSDYTPQTVDIVRQAGFERACSAFDGITGEGVTGSHGDRFQIPRMMVRDWDGDTFGRELRSALAKAMTHEIV